jgi:hypothetical protein
MQVMERQEEQSGSQPHKTSVKKTPERMAGSIIRFIYNGRQQEVTRLRYAYAYSLIENRPAVRMGFEEPAARNKITMKIDHGRDDKATKNDFNR